MKFNLMMFSVMYQRKNEESQYKLNGDRYIGHGSREIRRYMYVHSSSQVREQVKKVGVQHMRFMCRGI